MQTSDSDGLERLISLATGWKAFAIVCRKSAEHGDAQTAAELRCKADTLDNCASELTERLQEVIRNSEMVRRAALYQVGIAIENTDLADIAAVAGPLAAAHRVLANNRPDGEFAGVVDNDKLSERDCD